MKGFELMTRIGVSAIFLGVAFLAYLYGRLLELGYTIVPLWQAFPI
jgi:hypothetical protein